MERWLPIPGWGAYEVSDAGRVRRTSPSKHGGSRCEPGRVLRPLNVSNGYVGVRLYDGKRSRLCTIHRLVAEAFLGPSPLTVNHRNGDKHDNRVENLEWLTSGANTRHAVATGLRVSPVGVRNGSARMTDEQVRAIRRAPADVGHVDLARQYGVAASTIRRARIGDAWRHVR